MMKTGAEILCECLIKEGVEVIFGFPGGVLLPLYDTLPRYPELRHILVRHEQGAAHAADAYARVTGKIGVCLATSGPGATNLVTGIANAYLDCVPLLAITGQVPTNFIGKDAFQEIDITGITIPITKFNNLVTDVEEPGDADKGGRLCGADRETRPRAAGYTPRRVPGQNRVQFIPTRSTCQGLNRSSSAIPRKSRRQPIWLTRPRGRSLSQAMGSTSLPHTLS